MISIVQISDNEFRLQETGVFLKDISETITVNGKEYTHTERKQIPFDLAEYWLSERGKWDFYEYDLKFVLGHNIKVWDYTGFTDRFSDRLHWSGYSTNGWVAILQYLSDNKMIPLEICAGKKDVRESSLGFTNFSVYQSFGVYLPFCNYGFNNSVDIYLPFDVFLGTDWSVCKNENILHVLKSNIERGVLPKCILKRKLNDAEICELITEIADAYISKKRHFRNLYYN